MSAADSDAGRSTVACEFSTDHPLIVGDGDAFVVLYAEYLEICAGSNAGSEFPHEAMTALHLMDTQLINSSQIHNAHQIRCANALRVFFENPACGHMRFAVIANLWLFRGYLYPGTSDTPQWLDNPKALYSVISTLTQFLEEMTASEEADTDQIPFVVQTRTVLMP
ncbi:hypothetical protein R3P38DRAFT_3109094 [Favolaschia claudopus]|uniref:Uncharacterized protein n=1 Tax=Favolaschia claudopus TaxID=2862362 RepID=A0AAV9ZJA2_9AGAR